MNKNDILTQCGSIKSPSGSHILSMQSDGNLVLYNSKTNNAIWASGTFNKGTPPYQFKYQSDGNLVLYDNTNKALWTSNTNGRASDVLQLQEDGNLVVYAGTPTHTGTSWSGNAIWASGTNGK